MFFFCCYLTASMVQTWHILVHHISVVLKRYPNTLTEAHTVESRRRHGEQVTVRDSCSSHLLQRHQVMKSWFRSPMGFIPRSGSSSRMQPSRKPVCSCRAPDSLSAVSQTELQLLGKSHMASCHSGRGETSGSRLVGESHIHITCQEELYSYHGARGINWPHCKLLR